MNGLIRGVQVQPSHFECASEGDKSARYCAGLLRKTATTPHMTTVHALTTG